MSSCEMDQDEDHNDVVSNENASSSDEEDETDILAKAYDEVKTSIADNKYGYDLYVKLIDIAQKFCDLEKIRESHELFSSVYPLAPEIWLNWLKIEDKLVSTASDQQALVKMYRRALDDYFSVEIALEYSKFGSQLSNSAEICDEVLSVYGLHCTKGGQLFDFWKNFYREQDSPLSGLDRLTQIFEKELSIPHTGMEESYIEFKLLCEKNNIFDTINWVQIDEKYYKAKNILLKLLPYEKELSELDIKYHQERALLYIKYIDEGKEFLPADVLQTVYERMVASCCLDGNCWLKYIEYLEIREKRKNQHDLKKIPLLKQSALDVNNRALRNCTWNEKIHIKKLQLAEKLKYGKKDIQIILENALESGFSTPEAYVALWIEYLTYLRRNVNYDNENEVEILRKNFNLCWNSLGTQWGEFADCNCEILQFWGRLEYGSLNNHSKGKELWTTVMESSDNALKSALWLEFAQLEMKYGVDGARKIYQRALEQYNLDHPNAIAAAWLNLERCKGSLEDLLVCQDYLNNQAHHLTSQQTNKFIKSKENKKRKNTTKKPVQVVEEVAKSHKKVRLDKKEDKDLTEQVVIVNKPEPIADENENEEIDKSKDHLRIFLSNLSYDITKEKLREELKELEIVNIDIIKSPNGRGRGFGYLELTTEEEVDKALKLDRIMLDGRPVYISKMLRDKEERQKFKYSNTLEPTKLFVKGLPYDSTKEDLQKLFNEFGTIKDIRIIYHKSGKPKGIAYVDFTTESAASKAVLKLDQFEYHGFKLNVAISAPPAKSHEKETPNITKLLGVRREPKVRMSLIPTVIRKQSAEQNNKPVTEQKTNDDFRKFLQSMK